MNLQETKDNRNEHDTAMFKKTLKFLMTRGHDFNS